MGWGTEGDARGALCPSSWVLLPEQRPAVGRGRGGSRPRVGWVSWDCKLQLGVSFLVCTLGVMPRAAPSLTAASS